MRNLWEGLSTHNPDINQEQNLKESSTEGNPGETKSESEVISDSGLNSEVTSVDPSVNDKIELNQNEGETKPEVKVISTSSLDSQGSITEPEGSSAEVNEGHNTDEAEPEVKENDKPTVKVEVTTGLDSEESSTESIDNSKPQAKNEQNDKETNSEVKVATDSDKDFEATRTDSAENYEPEQNKMKETKLEENVVSTSGSDSNESDDKPLDNSTEVNTQQNLKESDECVEEVTPELKVITGSSEDSKENTIEFIDNNKPSEVNEMEETKTEIKSISTSELASEESGSESVGNSTEVNEDENIKESKPEVEVISDSGLDSKQSKTSESDDSMIPDSEESSTKSVDNKTEVDHEETRLASNNTSASLSEDITTNEAENTGSSKEGSLEVETKEETKPEGNSGSGENESKLGDETSTKSSREESSEMMAQEETKSEVKVLLDSDENKAELEGKAIELNPEGRREVHIQVEVKQEAGWDLEEKELERVDRFGNTENSASNSILISEESAIKSAEENLIEIDQEVGSAEVQNLEEVKPGSNIVINAALDSENNTGLNQEVASDAVQNMVGTEAEVKNTTSLGLVGEENQSHSKSIIETSSENSTGANQVDDRPEIIETSVSSSEENSKLIESEVLGEKPDRPAIGAEESTEPIQEEGRPEASDTPGSMSTKGDDPSGVSSDVKTYGETASTEKQKYETSTDVTSCFSVDESSPEVIPEEALAQEVVVAGTEVNPEPNLSPSNAEKVRKESEPEVGTKSHDDVNSEVRSTQLEQAASTEEHEATDCSSVDRTELDINLEVADLPQRLSKQPEAESKTEVSADNDKQAPTEKQ